MMLHFRSISASMRLRLIFIPLCFLLLGILIATGVTLYDAGRRINLETASGVIIGSHLIDYALDDVRIAQDPFAALKKLQTELAHVRHIRVEYKANSSSEPLRDILPDTGKEAPNWFLDWFDSERIAKSFTVIVQGHPYGKLVMWTKPSDEAAEVWEELVFLVGLLSAISTGIVTLIWLSASHTLKPLHELVRGLDRLQRGQFDALAEIRVAELRRLGEQFNQLAKSLAQTEADKRLLIDRLMSIQESERKELARELHDEFGASLFGIRAAASCIVEAAGTNRDKEGRFQEIAERANAISSMADSIQKHNYRILDRIQPVTLNQMGLYNAVHHLVENWRTAHRNFNCDLKTPAGRPVFSEDVNLTSYRIVQECLTNVARHSKATNVLIVMDCRDPACELSRQLAPHETGSATYSILISISDDGVGLPADFKSGFGILGMNERVRKLGGSLKVENGRSSGTSIEVMIPTSDIKSDAKSDNIILGAIES
jgi:two-component system sensor histidine kinase UhpB